MKKWLCVICGLIYDEAEGWPDDGIAPGTQWEDVPDDWTCPDCGVGKEDFEMIEMDGGDETAVAAAVSTGTSDDAPKL
uniref:Rubredoxin n=1 Tax=uncultured Thiotrichaceae bacterium TaxID=298394 RepID=A0A6S6TNV5_9GAMM|nr:MAG: Rubredoxin [uncultured Thiotrichaceae bacterium]